MDKVFILQKLGKLPLDDFDAVRENIIYDKPGFKFLIQENWKFLNLSGGFY